MKMLRILGMTFTGLLLICSPLIAGDFDGSKPLIFAVVKTVTCSPEGECQQGSADSISIPQFFEINFKEKLIRSTWGTGELRTTEILSMDITEDSLVLQGIQNNKAWGMSIGKENGRTTLAVSDAAEGYLVFGACIPR